MDTSSALLIKQNLQRDQQNIDIQNYLEQLTPLQKIAYEIAKDHLKTSFDITRSNGFNEWLSLQTK